MLDVVVELGDGVGGMGYRSGTRKLRGFELLIAKLTWPFLKGYARTKKSPVQTGGVVIVLDPIIRAVWMGDPEATIEIQVKD